MVHCLSEPLFTTKDLQLWQLNKVLRLVDWEIMTDDICCSVLFQTTESMIEIVDEITCCLSLSKLFSASIMLTELLESVSEAVHNHILLYH